MNITTRPYKKDPTRQHVDIMFPHPDHDTKMFRKRIVAPAGMDASAAKEWGKRQARELMRELWKTSHVAAEQETTQTQTIAPASSAGAPTLVAFWPAFEAGYIAQRKLSTRENYDSLWRNHLRPMLGTLPLDLIDIRAFARLRKSMRDKQLSPRMINAAQEALRQALRWAHGEGILTDKLIPSIEREKLRRRIVDVYSKDELGRLLAAAETTQDRVLVLLCWHGALRIGETAGLQWSDIHWSAPSMTIARNVYHYVLQDSPKGEVGTVALSAQLLAALKELHAEQGSRSAFVLQRVLRGEITHCSDRSTAKRLKVLQRRAGIRATGAHLIRHSTLTHLAQASVSPYVLQAFARHSSMTTTMRYYVHLDKAAMAAKAVCEFIDPEPAPMGRRGNRLATGDNQPRNGLKH